MNRFYKDLKFSILFSFTLTAIIFGVGFYACGVAHAMSRKQPVAISTPTPTPSASPTGTPEVLPNELRYSYKCAETCTAKEVATVARVETLIQKFIDSKCFEDAWHSFKRIEQSNGLNADGIIKKVRESSVKNIPLVFYWPTWRQSKSVIGYTYEGSPEIYLNRSFRQASYWNDWAEASNEFHETLHKIGFDHDFKVTERRPYSVPYLGNRAVEFCEGKIY